VRFIHLCCGIWTILHQYEVAVIYSFKNWVGYFDMTIEDTCSGAWWFNKSPKKLQKYYESTYCLRYTWTWQKGSACQYVRFKDFFVVMEGSNLRCYISMLTFNYELFLVVQLLYYLHICGVGLDSLVKFSL